MSLLSEILSAEQIDELYRAGYAIIPRHADPFELPAALIKSDWVYQWNDKVPDPDVKERPTGWTAVRYEQHPGWFAPPDASGPVTVNGMVLCQKLKEEVQEFHRQNKRKAEKLVEDWADRFGMFTGGATTLQTDGEEVIRTEITAGNGVEVKVETFERPATNTVELISKVPRDLLEHLDELFAERDRLIEEATDQVNGRQYLHTYSDDPSEQEMLDKFYDAIKQDRGAPWWPTLNAIVLPYAIENVRQKLKEGTAS